jgi:class 3 adenylate cyclase
MMALLASMPLVADFKELDYSDPVNTAKEVGFAAGMVFFAKTFNSKIRKVINQNYTQLLEESRERVWKKLRENPELEFLKDRFSEADNEVLIIVDGLIDTLISLKGLINPVGEDLELNEDGEIQTKEIDAVVIITDLRNFTALSEVLGGDIFPFLKLNYFSYLKELISQHGGKILNHTGDGLVVYFTDRKGMSKEDAAIQCTKELNHLTNTINDIWQMTGKIDKKDHGTGIGLSKGQIRIGDALSLGMEKKDSLIFRIYEAQQKMLMQSCPWTSKLETALNRKSIASLVGIGCPINLAARLESTAKEFPEYNGFIDENMYNSLAPRYRLKYHPLKKMPLKGIGDVMVYGMKRGK